MPASLPSQWTKLRKTVNRGQFLQRLNGMLVTPRLVWTPKSSDTTTATTDEAVTGRTLTFDATVASRLLLQGRGTKQTFTAASSQYGTTPDTVDMSFGNATVDSAFSIIALINVASSGTDREIVSKWNTSAWEWTLRINATTNLLNMILDDVSVPVNASRASNAAIGLGAWHLVGMTYDGTGGATAANGITLYQDGAVIASTATNSGTYVAMENTVTAIEIGSSTVHTSGFMDGTMALVAVTAVALTAAQHASITSLCRRYFTVPT